MANVRFSLKRKTGMRSTLRALVSHEGERTVLSTGISIAPGEWDAVRERVKMPAQPEREHALNTALEQIRADVLQNLRETGKATRTKEIVEKRLEPATLAQALENQQKRMYAAGRSKYSITAYTSLFSVLGRFNATRQDPAETVMDITRNYIEDFARWMNARNQANGTTRKAIGLLSTILKHERTDLEWQGAARPQDKTADMIYLTRGEIEKIRQFEGNAKQNEIRDCFLVSCYTGLRFSDTSKVRPERITSIKGSAFITINTQKTDTKVIIPVSERLKEMVMRYPDGFTKISNQEMNTRIKQIGAIAGITEQVEIARYIGGKKIITTLPKCNLITCHTGRRSFVTNAILAGIPASEVMKFTGHKNIHILMKYVRTTGEIAAMTYADHPYFSEE